MSKNEEIVNKLKKVLFQSEEDREKELALKASSLLLQLPELVKYINEKNPVLNNEIFYDLGRYINYNRFPKGKIIQHIAQGDNNYFYMILTGNVAKIGIKYKKINMSCKEYILHLTKLQLLNENFLKNDSIKRNKDIFPFKLEKNMISVFKKIQFFDYNKELENIINIIENSKWKKEQTDINDYLDLINPEYLAGKENILSIDKKYRILLPYYFQREILGPNTFIGHLFKSKEIKELSSYICINNCDLLYVNKSVFPAGCRLIKIFEQKFNYELIQNIIKNFIIFENVNTNYLIKHFSNNFQQNKIKKGEKLIIQDTPQEGIYFVSKGEFQLRTMKSYYELQELIFSLRDSLDIFKDYISLIKNREADDINNKTNNKKINLIFQNPLFMLKAKEKKDIILSTYYAPKIVGLNEFYDNKTGIYHFSLYCQSEDAEVYFLNNKLFNSLYSNDSLYKKIVHMIEEKVEILIFLIKRYKSLYEAEFMKYISSNKSTNNDSNEISKKKIFKYPNLQSNQESKNSSEENNFKKYKIIPLKINTDIISQPRYNIIKKKLFHCIRNQNIRLDNIIKKEDSVNIYCGARLKRNKIIYLKNSNKSVSHLEQNEIIKNLNISMPQKENLNKNRRLLKVESHSKVRKNLFKIININLSQDNNLSFRKDSEKYSEEKKYSNNNLINNSKKEKYKKIRLKSISNIKLNSINTKSLIKENYSKIEKLLNNSKNEKDIYKIEDKKDNFINNKLNKNDTNLNSFENINNKNIYNLNKKKIYIINGKKITLRNSFANINENNNTNIKYSFNPLKSLNLENYKIK